MSHCYNLLKERRQKKKIFKKKVGEKKKEEKKTWRYLCILNEDRKLYTFVNIFNFFCLCT